MNRKTAAVTFLSAVLLISGGTYLKYYDCKTVAFSGQPIMAVAILMNMMDEVLNPIEKFQEVCRIAEERTKRGY